MSRKSSFGWIVFFVVLAALATTGIILPIVYNLGQQLRAEQLESAERLWHEKGPRDYDLRYDITYDKQRLAERHVVQVRDGAVLYEACEGEVVAMPPAVAATVGLPMGASGEGGSRDIPGIFAHIRTRLEEEKAERRNFMVAVFDPREGYPRRFIWRLRGTKTREEWDIRLFPAGALSNPEAPWKTEGGRRN